MTIETKPEGSAVVAAVNGRLDGVTAEDFGKAMREVIQNGATRLVLDLGHVSYISSRGVGELVVAAKTSEKQGGTFCVANVPENVLAVLQMCGLASIIPIHCTVADALAAV
jgi:anti-sigma B factor antagonist